LKEVLFFIGVIMKIFVINAITDDTIISDVTLYPEEAARIANSHFSEFENFFSFDEVVSLVLNEEVEHVEKDTRVIIFREELEL
jgi:hypothetical protein